MPLFEEKKKFIEESNVFLSTNYLSMSKIDSVF